MIKSILIPTDGSGFANIALDYGIYIAKKLGATLIGLHVIDVRLMQPPVVCDLSGSIGIPPCSEFISVEETSLDAKADRILNAFMEKCKAAGVNADSKKVVGVIDETIIEEGRKTDWILLAQRGEHLHLGGIGSIAGAVIRKSGRPVVVTPPTYIEIESMALAYDGSPPAHNALNLAATLSQEATWPLTVIIITDDQAVGAKLTKNVEVFLEPYNIDSDTILFKGNEDRVIINFLKEGSVELLVMGAYGHNRLRELLLGSTTNQIIQKTSIPVILHR